MCHQLPHQYHNRPSVSVLPPPHCNKQYDN
jgi:hypothetical protein